MRSVLFVCLGNICRSPMAEGLFRHKLAARGLTGAVEVDSAGTAAYHAGEPADPRTLEVLRRRGGLCSLVARQVRVDDFRRFELVLAMDASNVAALRRVAPSDATARVALVRAPVGGGDVPDPYYGGPQGFDRVYDMLDEALEAWLADATWARTRPG